MAIVQPKPSTNRTPSALALAAATAFACTAAAQITVPISNVQLTATGSAAASPNAAYSNITTVVGTQGTSSGNGISAFTVFDDLTPLVSSHGQIVQSIRLGIVCNPSFGLAQTRRTRLQIGFWNADGPNGLAGTPIQGLAGFAQYETSTLTMNFDQLAIVTLDLGNAGFAIPSGRFFFGFSTNNSGFAETSSTDFGPIRYFPPTAGSTVGGEYAAGFGNGIDVFGIPWGVTFGLPGSPQLGALSPGAYGLGVELVIPSPSAAMAIGLTTLLGLTRRRRVAPNPLSS